MMDTKDAGMKTYGWYTTHYIHPGCDEYKDKEELSKNGCTVGGPETQAPVMKRNLETLGVLDQVPTFENLKPLIDTYSTWYKKVQLDWNEYEKEKMRPLVTLHWILDTIIQDPLIDPRVLEYVVKKSPKNLLSVVYNSRVPEELLIRLLSLDPKKDPMLETNGGEIGCFILHNEKVSSKVVDIISRKTKTIRIQKGCIDHPNVSRDTLVFLSQEGRSETVKRDALRALVSRGWLKVK